MFRPTSLRYFVVFVLLIMTSSTLYSQVSRTSGKRHKDTRTKEITLTADGRSRKTMGSSDRERRSGARTLDLKKTNKQDGPQKGPVIGKLKKAGTFDGDLRSLPYQPVVKRERPERERPEPNPLAIIPPIGGESQPVQQPSFLSALSAPAPTPSMNFDGLDFANWGAGHPPDPNGDVGPTYYIDTVNTSVGIYNKTTGVRVAAFTFDTFMSQGNFGNLCDTDNFGDPVVVYDTFEDRWVISDFAFQLDGSGNVINPPGSFQCFAVSKTGDPVSGGWNFYSINTTSGLGDYPKIGVWTDGIYLSVNMFDYAAAGSYQNPRVYAFNKAQMYAGAQTVQVFSFDAPSNDFTILPANARLQTGTPPAGTSEYFASTELFLNAVAVYKYHVDWNHPSLTTFTGPDVQLAPTCWPNATPANAATPGNAADVLAIRAMMQNQYSNIGGTESLWLTHTVERGESATNTTCNATTGGNATPRWYQLNVTGGTVAANMVQGKTWDPDGANTFYRFMPSLAVNRNGDMALGYSKSNSTTNPQIKYAGRLAGDPVNTFSFTEQTLIDGTGSQTGNCGGGPCIRWGDYSAMTIDPDGCTFWYTNEYYAVSGLNDLTRIGAFSYPTCTAFANNGTLQGTVVSSVGNVPLQGVTVSLGTRTATTDASGNYSIIGLPAGLYLSETAALPGYVTGSTSNISIPDAGAVIRNFTLTPANDANCFSDTSQSDFQTATLNNTDLTVSPGNVVLAQPIVLDQSNTSLGTSGTALNSTTWWGETFTEAITGTLKSADINLFCSTCTGTAPNLTLSIRATSAGLPTGPDLASTTLTGNNSGAASYFSGTFSSGPTLTAGTVYALIVRPVSNPSAGTYAATFSSSNVYAGGQRVTSSDSGSTWNAPNPSRDLGFHIYVKGGYAASGDFTSGIKDSNSAVAGTNVWGTLVWNATVPANTTLKFQAAASNSPFGPFNFVGPDGTAGTFFASGGSLSQFNGLRYLKYKAYLTTTDGALTPTLSDVTICDINPRVWTGAVSSDWNNAANWSSSGVPGPSDSADLPSTGVVNNPASAVNISVNRLIIGDGRVVDLGSNSLTVNDCSSGAVSGGSANSFIKGKLIRCINGAGPYAFPVGTTGGYAPVTLSGTAGTGTFTINPVDGVLTGADPANSIHRYWDLTPSGVTQANITLAYNPLEYPGGSVPESSYKFLRRDLSGTAGISASSSNTTDPTLHTFTLNNVTAFSSWSIGTLLAPTAAGVNVSGRVVRSSGTGILNAIVKITDSNGISRFARTNSFGYFNFDDVTAGQTYIVTVQAKGYSFAPQTLSVSDSITNLVIVAQP